MSKIYAVYILTNYNNSCFYIGVTNNLKRRVLEHKNEKVEGHTRKYHINKLIYFELTENVTSAIKREKQLKNWHRQWKINLIKEKNPNFDDLFFDL